MKVIKETKQQLLFFSYHRNMKEKLNLGALNDLNTCFYNTELPLKILKFF